MRWVPPRRVGVIVATAAAAAALAAAGCGAEEPTTAQAAAASTATTVCSLLRGWDNELSDSLNATSKRITDADDPKTANGVLLDGYDRLIELARGHAADVDDLVLPYSVDRARLLDDLHGGVDRAVAELEDRRDEISDLPPITVEGQRGALGGAFTSLEKAQSEVEPEIDSYDDATLRQAFADEPGCEHVIQPF